MSGSGKALINIIYEDCLMHGSIAQGIKISKSLKVFYTLLFQAPKGGDRERCSKFLNAKISRAIRLFSRSSGV